MTTEHLFTLWRIEGLTGRQYIFLYIELNLFEQRLYSKINEA